MNGPVSCCFPTIHCCLNVWILSTSAHHHNAHAALHLSLHKQKPHNLEVTVARPDTRCPTRKIHRRALISRPPRNRARRTMQVAICINAHPGPPSAPQHPIRHSVTNFSALLVPQLVIPRLICRSVPRQRRFAHLPRRLNLVTSCIAAPGGRSKSEKKASARAKRRAQAARSSGRPRHFDLSNRRH